MGNCFGSETVIKEVRVKKGGVLKIENSSGVIIGKITYESNITSQQQPKDKLTGVV